MDRASVSPPTVTATPEDHEHLLSAAREALRLLDAQDAHLPIDAPRVGGEGHVRKQLREAVRRCSFEVRACEACDDGTTYAPTRHPMERPRLVSCPECGGSGERRVFAYERPKARRSR